MNFKATSTYNPGKIVYWLFFAMLVAGFGYVFFSYPKMFDDWEFDLEFLYKGADANGHHTLWRGVCEALFSLNRSSSMRLGNTIGPLLLLVPRWIPSLLSTLCFGLCVWLMAKLADIKDDQWIKLSVLSFLIVFGIDWEDCLFCQMFLFNYIVVIPIFIFAIMVFIKIDRFGWLGGAVIALIVSLWHEAYGAAFFGGSLMTIVLLPEYRCKSRIAMTLASFIGLLIMLSMPSLWSRKEDVLSLTLYKPSLVYLTECVLALCIIIFCLFNKKYFGVIKNPLAVFTFFSCLGLIPLVFYTSFIRVALPAMILSMIFIVWSTSRLFPRFYQPLYWGSVVFGVTLLIVCSVHLIAVGIVTNKYREVVEEAMNRAWKNKGVKNIFTPIVYPSDNTWLALNRPDKHFLTNSSSSSTLWYIRNVINDYHLNFLPEELLAYSEGEGERLSGNGDYRIWEGHLISENLNDTIQHWANIYYSNYKDVSPLDHAVFTGNDGREYVYTVFRRSLLGRYAGAPVAIDFDVEF